MLLKVSTYEAAANPLISTLNVAGDKTFLQLRTQGTGGGTPNKQVEIVRYAWSFEKVVAASVHPLCKLAIASGIGTGPDANPPLARRLNERSDGGTLTTYLDLQRGVNNGAWGTTDPATLITETLDARYVHPEHGVDVELPADARILIGANEVLLMTVDVGGAFQQKAIATIWFEI